MLACRGSGGTLLVLKGPCWFVLLLRSDMQKFLLKPAKLLWKKRKQIEEITSSSESKLSQGEKREGHCTEEKKKPFETME